MKNVSYRIVNLFKKCMRFTALIIFLFYFTVGSYAQQEKVSLISIFEQALSLTEQDTIEIKNKQITLEGLRALEEASEFYSGFSNVNESIDAFLVKKYGKQILDSNERVYFKPAFSFENCLFPDLIFVNLHFNDFTILSCRNQNIEESNLSFDGIQIYNTEFNQFVSNGNKFNFLLIAESLFNGKYNSSSDKYSGNIQIESSKFLSSFFMESLEISDVKFTISIVDCIFKSMDTHLKIPKQINPNQFLQRCNFRLSPTTEVSFLYLAENTFSTDNKYDYSSIQGAYGGLYITLNTFESILSLGCSLEEKFIFEDNDLQSYFDIVNFLPPEVYNALSFEDIKGYKLISAYGDSYSYQELIDSGYAEDSIYEILAQTNYEPLSYYFGESKDELSNTNQYKDLITSYYRLYAIFKSNGDINSANSAYIEMKEVDARKLKYIAMSEKNFKSLFRWGLNRLLFYYTSHGTDPAKAIVTSFYVILFFGGIYFLFGLRLPYSVFRRYVKLLKGSKPKIKRKTLFKIRLFGLILIDSISLSVNSFITLGFGSIPQYGGTKYFTIIEGFVGWFLLSIFTVALINQVLF